MAHHPHPSDVHYGPGAVEHLLAVIERAGARRVLLVCGATSLEASGAARVVPAVEQVTELTRWSEFSPNTDAADLARGLALAADLRPDLVVGVGGGSAMDMAKLVCAFAGTPPTGLAAAIPAQGPVGERHLGLVLAPTTSGSGSEATHFAVVYVGDAKYSIAGPGLYPDTVLLDPDLGRSGSAHQRATSGIDAVCQSIESLWATGATDHSRRLARHALGLLLGAIERFVAAPDDRSARAMSLGSHLAGRAIDISKTTAAHALSYGITKRYGVNHGNAVALTLGHFIEAHAAAGPDRLQPGIEPGALADALRTIFARLGATDGTTARHRFVDLLSRIGLASTLGEVGVQGADEHRELVAGVNVERLGNNPVVFDPHGLEGILRLATPGGGTSQATPTDHAGKDPTCQNR